MINCRMGMRRPLGKASLRREIREALKRRHDLIQRQIFVCPGATAALPIQAMPKRADAICVSIRLTFENSGLGAFRTCQRADCTDKKVANELEGVSAEIADKAQTLDDLFKHIEEAS
jgi:hypothetical protein